MGMLQQYRLLLLCLKFCSLPFLSSAYTPPDKLFINCGSVSKIAFGGRDFVGDINAGSTSFSVGASESITDTSSSKGKSLYQTARLFRRQSLYEINVGVHGIYCLRLHFYAFKEGSTDLGHARFHVSASKFSLLSDFSVKSGRDSPRIEEFFLTINTSKITINFTPRKRNFAFVSAVEIFVMPGDDKPGDHSDFVADDLDLITPAGDNTTRYRGVRSKVLHTIHRLNVGGEEVNDTLWRNWKLDGSYLMPAETSTTMCQPYAGPLHYVLGALQDGAPEFVYRTCRELGNFANVTWGLPVNRNVRHLVRLHFCDIVSDQPYLFKFNLFINSKYREVINPFGITNLTNAPFYFDYIVDTDDSGYLNVSVGPRQDSPFENAILNGVEIMEFVKDAIPVNAKRNVWVIVGPASGSVVFLAVFFLLWLRGKKVRQARTVGLSSPSPDGGGKHFCKIVGRNGSSSHSAFATLNLKLKMSLGELLHATENFHDRLLIGEGGFGRVYLGTLQSGRRVAVKRSDPRHNQGLPEFETEIRVLSKIRHRHLVSLIGYCNEAAEMILVYEYMEKGTLRDHLYGKSCQLSSSPKLSWRQRLEICIGSARGLHYLHSGADGGIIHRDVKSTNILLDENYVAKVADFGLSRTGPLDPDHFSVGIKGSFGYMDPEYFKTFQFTEKADVYSFGVVLLEALCARPAITTSSEGEKISLAEWGIHWLKKGELEIIIDPFLVGKMKPNSLRKFGETVEKCLRRHGEDRPAMQDVLWDLEYALQLEKTAVNSEAYEDSTAANGSSELPLLQFQRLRSSSILAEEDHSASDMSGAAVFS